MARAQALAGRVGLLVVAGLLLRPFVEPALILTGVVLVTLFPARRRLVLSATGALYLLDLLRRRRQLGLDELAAGQWSELWARWGPVLSIGLLLLAAAYLVVQLARRFDRLPRFVRRHPIVALQPAVLLVLAVVWMTPRGAAWRPYVFLLWGVLPFFLWRVGYLLLSAQRGRAQATRLRDHLFYLWPAFGGTDVPYGKGLDTLARHEARDGEAFARSQLAGVKLLVLACMWHVALRAMAALVFGDADNAFSKLTGGRSLHVPHVWDLFHGESASVPMAWLAVYAELVRATLALAVFGHTIVGSLRLMGFNVFRNTYKPLLAESVVDFWNRYYYYFKELLVEFFFYPIYLRSFKRRPRLRMFAATFAAAFVGNLYYHVLRERQLLSGMRFGELWQELSPRVCYCFLLSLGIFVSMLRQQAARGGAGDSGTLPAPLRRLGRIAGVWTFFGLIHVFSLAAEAGLTDRLTFLLSLVGVQSVTIAP